MKRLQRVSFAAAVVALAVAGCDPALEHPRPPHKTIARTPAKVAPRAERRDIAADTLASALRSTEQRRTSMEAELGRLQSAAETCRSEKAGSAQELTALRARLAALRDQIPELEARAARLARERDKEAAFVAEVGRTAARTDGAAADAEQLIHDLERRVGALLRSGQSFDEFCMGLRLARVRVHKLFAGSAYKFLESGSTGAIDRMEQAHCEARASLD